MAVASKAQVANLNIGGRKLSGGEFYCPQEGLEPITPTNFFMKAVTRNGAKEGVRVQQLESGTLFLQRQGKSLNEFAFTDTQLTYVTSKISLLAGHLLKSPTRMALRRSVATDENDLLFIVNSTGGTIAAFSMLRVQNVIAPSEFTTDGEFFDGVINGYLEPEMFPKGSGSVPSSPNLKVS